MYLSIMSFNSVSYTHLCDSLEKKSVILLEQIRTIDKVRFQEKLGSLNDYFMKKVNDAIKTSLDLK